MLCSKILVAYDGSDSAEKALQMALSICKLNESIELVLVSVCKLYAMGSGAEAAMMASADKTRTHLEEVAHSIPNPATVRLLKGAYPADLILNCAKEEACDLIIMGSRGKGGMKGYLGSVSYAVIQASPISVLIAKDSVNETIAGAMSDND